MFRRLLLLALVAGSLGVTLKGLWLISQGETALGLLLFVESLLMVALARRQFG
jgi:hypothetical protein